MTCTYLMEEHNFSPDIFEIMKRELGEIGHFIVKNQCTENGIMYTHITWEDIPRLSRALSEVMLTFGEDKAKKISKEIEELVDVHRLLEIEKDPLIKAKMLSQLGDSSALCGNLEDALKYYYNARENAVEIEPLRVEIDKRIHLISKRLEAACRN